MQEREREREVDRETSIRGGAEHGNQACGSSYSISAPLVARVSTEGGVVSEVGNHIAVALSTRPGGVETYLAPAIPVRSNWDSLSESQSIQHYVFALLERNSSGSE